MGGRRATGVKLIVALSTPQRGGVRAYTEAMAHELEAVLESHCHRIVWLR